MKSKIKHQYKDINSIKSPNQCFSWWMVHAFLYYRLDQAIISDKEFDTLTSWLKMSWQVITHPHKHLVSLEDLEAGTGYAIEFPKIVEGSANHVLRTILENKGETKPKKHSNKKAKSISNNSKPNKTFDEYDTLFG
jgi:NAD-dependent DNA ligase